jgi:hypothetical protein
VPELDRRPPADAPVAADDVVVAQPLDRPPPPSFRQRAGENAAGNPFDENRGDVGKDSQSREDEEDRHRPRRVGSRDRVQSGQRGRHDRPVERLQPALVQRRVEGDRPGREDQEQRPDRVPHPARAERLPHPSSILDLVEGEGDERQLNIHLDPDHLAGVYANFANISFSDYEFTITFARIDHEVEEGDVPGVVVSRVNMSTRFMKELIDAMNDSWSKWSSREGIRNLPETTEGDTN